MRILTRGDDTNMKKKSVYITIGVITISLLIPIYRTYSMMNRMNQDIRNINSIVSRIERDMDSIESRVLNSVNRVIEEKKWLYDVDYSISDVSKDLQDATVTLNWSVRELSKDASMYLLYGIEDEKNHVVSEWNEISAEDLGNLSYKGQLTLPFQNNYQFKVLTNDADSTISQKLTDIRLLDKISNRMDIEANPMTKTTSDNHVNIGFSVDVENRYDLNHWGGVYKNVDGTLLKIKNIKTRVYSNEILKKEIDIYKDGQIVDDKAIYKEPFKRDTDIQIEELSYETNIEYDSVPDSNEVIEVIVEDYLGRIYTDKSHEM